MEIYKLNEQIEQALLDFNHDQDFIELRERYSTRSFLEIMSVERSENRHSSFLAWLLEAKDFAVNHKDHPIVHLMDILIRRMGKQKNDDVQYEVLETLKNTILARDFKEVNIEEVKREKTVKDVATKYKELNRDKLDIYIKGTFTTSTEPKTFEIIIENKVGSTEGGEKGENRPYPDKDKDGNTISLSESQKQWNVYCGWSQTKRYYEACNNANRIFVFLTPITNAELDDFNNIDKDKKSEDKHFININYQDILDEIIEPLLANKNISQRVRILLEEYVLSLSLPGQYTDEDNENKKLKSAIIMAERKRDVEIIKQLFDEKSKYKTLIISAAKCLSNEDDIQNIYKNWPKQPAAINKRKEKLKEAIRSSLDFPVDNQENLVTLDHVYTLLVSFGNTYKNLFIAFLKTYIENQDCETIDETLSVIKDTYQSLLGAPKDRSEFTVEKSRVKELDEEVKRSFAKFIIEKYIEYYNNNSNVVDPLTYFENIKDMYPLCQNPNDPTRYFPESIKINNMGDFFISNQWGITRNPQGVASKDEYFDKIFRKVFGQALYDIEEGERVFYQ